MARSKQQTPRRGATKPVAVATTATTEAAESLSMDDGLILTTAFLLLVATVLVFFQMNAY